ncbi:hypothetical protein [Flammeovirga aprica]|uniref:Uncharacterized protein n=1 Tax=Flammeovirga aprica JL-4 TaxID=694437 RepID=A0A7X9RS17_9BACT|nr:hypothetical protein [Flammeovirga aprica]NME66496.1 hypothetical protein [Flammeovirga aprica JL-4]
MKKYLYYPNLEPPNTEWLKFAILYLENFESIVPYQRQHLVSDEYRRLQDETDLVSMYSPEYNQGYRASLKAIEEADKFIDKPYQRSHLFRRVNLQRDWRNRENWNYQIFSEKFSNEWAEYCEDKGIGGKNEEGLMLPKELAFLFMTYLAKEISHERNGSIITDNIEYDNYTNYERIHNPIESSRNKFLMNLMNFLIPANISDISIKDLIKFRNKNRERIKAFNRQIDLVEDSISNGLSERDLIEGFNDTYSGLTKEILLFGVGVASIPFAGYLLINNPVALTAEYAKEIIGAMGIGFGGTFAINNALYDSSDRRMCKKYLANVRRIK